MSGSNFTEHHVATPVNYGGVPARAIALLEQAAACLRERSRSYNGNDFDYEDYKLNGVEDTWADILECFGRLWESKNPDKAVDWVGYSALQAAFIEAGCPKSKFAPIFRRLLSEHYRNLKERDCGYSRVV